MNKKKNWLAAIDIKRLQKNESPCFNFANHNQCFLQAQSTLRKNRTGFTLIETLLGMTLFVIVALSIYLAYSNLLDILIASQSNSTSISLLENELETIRNMPYPDIGIQGGSPPGIIPAQKTVYMDSAPYTVITTIRNIDDPFDGTAGEMPDDNAPADYKLIELVLECPGCSKFFPITMTSWVAPKGLESASLRGSLFISVHDAFGQPINSANVSVINSSVSPPVNINDVTDINGELKLIDIATSSVGYRITVSKSGYSSERTYPPGNPGNPNPTKPDATVIEQSTTQVSFEIDRTSTLDFRTTNNMCIPTANIDFQQTGFKLIGLAPDVKKYSQALLTDGVGQNLNNSLEWDTYTFDNVDADYDVAGSTPLEPLVVDPATSHQMRWIMTPKSPLAFLVTTVDETDATIDDASVELTSGGFGKTKITGRDTFSQADWSFEAYTSKTSNVETDDLPGSVTIAQIGGIYATSSEQLISETFDLGTSDTTFYSLNWNPISQPPQAGTDSIQFQIATNNDNLIWNFVGPDGTGTTYYTSSGTQIHVSHNNNRYLRYQLLIETEDSSVTPTLDDIEIEFSSSCLSGGQAFFNNLVSGTYTLTIQKDGFTIFVDNNVDILNDWQEYKAILIP